MSESFPSLAPIGPFPASDEALGSFEPMDVDDELRTPIESLGANNDDAVESNVAETTSQLKKVQKRKVSLGDLTRVKNTIFFQFFGGSNYFF